MASSKPRTHTSRTCTGTSRIKIDKDGRKASGISWFFSWASRRGRPLAAPVPQPAVLPVAFAVVVAGAGPVPGAVAEAAVLVHRAHHYGHLVEPGAAHDAQSDLLVHHAPLPLLLAQQAGLAEFHQAQPQLERLLRQAAEGQEEGREGLILDTGTQRRRHVRERKL